MKDGADARTQLELALVKAADPSLEPTAKALLARVERLEAHAGAPPPPRPAGRAPEVAATAAGRAAAPPPPDAAPSTVSDAAPSTVPDAAPSAAPSAAAVGAPSAAAVGAPSAAPSGAPSAARSGAPDAARSAAPDAAPPSPGEPVSEGPPAATTEGPPQAVTEGPPEAAAGGKATVAVAAQVEGESTTVAVAVAEADAPARIAELELHSFAELWPAVLETLGQESAMLAAALQAARPARLDGAELTLAWPETHGLHRRKAEDVSNRDAIARAIRAVTGTSLRLAHEIRAEAAGDTAAGPPTLSEDELIERFQKEFDAEILSDEDESPREP
jgi:DNA polymerase-3 subunit gamma/tau